MATSRQQQQKHRRSGARPEPDAATLPGEHAEVVDALLEALDARGAPSGAWLVDIARVRRALQDADSLLRRLEEAVIRDASSAPAG